jgi:hypothetical protein
LEREKQTQPLLGQNKEIDMTMDEKYEIGSFGEARFIAKKGWKAPTVCHGKITDVDAKCVEFTDNDNNIYIIPKSRFSFVKKEFKVLTQK